MKHPLLLRVGLALTFLAIGICIPSLGSAATQKYVFSGPSVAGRFVIEPYSVSTPNPNEERIEWLSLGSPYSFSATAGDLSYATDSFQLTVRNNLVAFGRSDQYVLVADGLMGLVLMGPSLALPYTSTLPHDLAAYSDSTIFHWPILQPVE